MGGMSAKARRYIKRKIRLAKLSDGKCAYCGKQLTWYVGQENRHPHHDALTIDHVIPRCKFKPFVEEGYSHIENQVVCCVKCNNSKGDKIYMDEWLPGWGRLISPKELSLKTWEDQKAKYAAARKSGNVPQTIKVRSSVRS